MARLQHLLLSIAALLFVPVALAHDEESCHFHIFGDKGTFDFSGLQSAGGYTIADSTNGANDPWPVQNLAAERWFGSNAAHFTAFYGLDAHACGVLCDISTGNTSSTSAEPSTKR